MGISDWSSDGCSSDLSGDQAGRITGSGKMPVRSAPPPHGHFPSRSAGITFSTLARGAGLSQLARKAAPPPSSRTRNTRRAIDIRAIWQDRKSVVEGRSVSVRESVGGRGIINKKSTSQYNAMYNKNI